MAEMDAIYRKTCRGLFGLAAADHTFKIGDAASSSHPFPTGVEMFADKVAE